MQYHRINKYDKKSVYIYKELNSFKLLKNQLTYYLIITLPLILLGLLSHYQVMDSVWFTAFLFVYLLVYRTFVDGKRLVAKGIIQEKDIWKLLIPGKRYTYFRDLYLH